MTSVMTLSAFGDALGVPYEFGQRRLVTGQRPALTVGDGRWSDDTSMALAIATSLVAHPVVDETLFDAVAESFRDWLDRDGVGVGRQTRWILQRCSTPSSAAEQRELARRFAADNPKAAGNGSLMRIHPVSLVSDDREVVAELAREMTRLTYVDQRCLDISVLWCEMLRVARISGELVPQAGLDLLPASSRDDMASLIKQALTGPSEQFSTQGWWVVPAFGQALSAVAHNMDGDDAVLATFTEILSAPESDCDTICCIAGGLLGALGRDEIPDGQLAQLHGVWPSELGVEDLRQLESQLLICN